MSFNDQQEQADYLLQWVNQERYVLEQTTPFVFLEQVAQSNFVQLLLLNIDCNYFSPTVQKPFQFQVYFSRIEGYLEEVHGKRFRKQIKQKLTQEESIQDFTKILLYLSLQSKIKNECVSRIFQLSNATQKFLMEELQQMESKVENIMEVKQILAKLEELEDENDHLKDKLKDLTANSNKLMELYLEQQEECSKLNEECSNYKKEKAAVMEELNIVSLKEYMLCYNDIRMENDELISTVNYLERHNDEITTENSELKGKVAESAMAITYLNDEITRYKQIYGQMKNELSFYNDQQDNPLRENRNFNNIDNSGKMRSSVETNNQTYTSINLFEEEEVCEGEKIKQYNVELMQKLQLMYKKVSELTGENSDLAEANKDIRKKNKFNERKIKDLKKLHEAFVKEYEFTITG